MNERFSVVTQLINALSAGEFLVFFQSLSVQQQIGFALLTTGFLIFIVGVVLRLVQKKPTSKPLTEKEAEKKLQQLEKQRIKREDAEAKEREKKEVEKEKERLAQIEKEQEQLQAELRKQEEQQRNKQLLTKEILTEEAPAPAPENWLERLKQGVSKTRNHLVEGLSSILLGKKEIDAEVLEEIEELMISADIGTETTYKILEAITQKVERKELQDPTALQKSIQEEIEKIMAKEYPLADSNDTKPFVLLFVGVNGVGKTTTIGKIASYYHSQGKKVLMGAGDTFRAAAIEQLTEWSKRVGCDIVTKDPESDPSAVMYETVEEGVKQGYDVILCDTAGRLHTKKNLMEELKKMVRVIKKVIPEAPHEVLLVLDATTGQNAIYQAKEFLKATEVTGIVITKLDGTAKGGVVIGISHEFEIPVRYIGVGEKIHDLRPFSAKEFTESLFS